MSVNNPKHKRRSIRLPEYDYLREGAYYITICAQDRKCIFGEITDGQMKLNPYGEIARNEWVKTGELRPYVIPDVFVIMPNHIHGVLIITDDDHSRGTMHRAPTGATERFGKPVAGSLPTIIRCYTAAVTRQINKLRNTPGHKIWQRNYYEHVIRNDKSYHKIRQYIIENPLYWAQDDENPNREKPGS